MCHTQQQHMHGGNSTMSALQLMFRAPARWMNCAALQSCVAQACVCNVSGLNTAINGYNVGCVAQVRGVRGQFNADTDLHGLIVGLVISECLLGVDQCCQQHSTTKHISPGGSSCYIGPMRLEALLPATSSNHVMVR